MAGSPSQLTPHPPTTLLNLPDGLSPDSLDTVPVLASILSRLQTPGTNTTVPAGSPPAASPSQLAAGTGHLSIKDIPSATDSLKHKLQTARVQVKELPDIDRSVQEQEEEIRELERRIGEQRAVLESLRGIGMEARRERVEAGGMET
jgi:hypothetical protein